MIKRLFFAINLIGLCLLASPAAATAKNLYGGVDCGQASNSAVCHPGDPSIDPISGDQRGHHGALIGITNIISYVAGAAAIIVIIYSGIKFITSGSDVSTGARQDTDVENAKRAIANALVGLAIIVLARTILVFALKRL